MSSLYIKVCYTDETAEILLVNDFKNWNFFFLYKDLLKDRHYLWIAREKNSNLFILNRVPLCAKTRECAVFSQNISEIVSGLKKSLCAQTDRHTAMQTNKLTSI